MFRPRLRAPRIGLVRANLGRSVHSLPPLDHNFREGIPGLLSAAGFRRAWTDYMTLTLEKLDAAIAGKPEFSNRGIKQIAMETARQPSQAHIFNYASMAHNNDFFFRGLSPRNVAMPASLQRAVENNFGSVETLRRELVVTASAMFGPGFVWLVKAHLPASGHNHSLRVLTTYLAGSPYPAAHFRRQPLDLNTLGNGGPDEQRTVSTFLNQGRLTPDEARRPPGGIEVTPLLCVNTWEHVWLQDYGLGVGGEGGKKGFVEAWWESVDWELVTQLANLAPKPLAR